MRPTLMVSSCSWIADPHRKMREEWVMGLAADVLVESNIFDLQKTLDTSE